jgi:hypothetical protein
MLRSPEKFELHPILRVAVLMPVYVKTPDDWYIWATDAASNLQLFKRFRHLLLLLYVWKWRIHQNA